MYIASIKATVKNDKMKTGSVLLTRNSYDTIIVIVWWREREGDTDALYVVISPTSEGGHIHLNIVTITLIANDRQ